MKFDLLEELTEVIEENYTITDITISGRKFFVGVIDNVDFDIVTLETIQNLEFVEMSDKTDDEFIGYFLK